MFLNIQGDFNLLDNISFEKVLSIGNSKSKVLVGYLLVNVGMVLMFFFHELGHVLLGLKTEYNRIDFHLFFS